MLSGTVTDGLEAGWKLAFPGRAEGQGPWELQERKCRVPGAHGDQSLYNMMGCKVFETDMLVLTRSSTGQDGSPDGHQRLEVPCLSSEKNDTAIMLVPRHVQKLLAKALDCLPWSTFSWSIHQGLKDILVAYGKPIMDSYRLKLAHTLMSAVRDHEKALVERGWDADFVHDCFEDMAETSILAGRGSDGDMVRIVVDIVEILMESSEKGSGMNRDQTLFWRNLLEEDSKVDSHLDMEAVVALTKFFVLEWSQKLDYSFYHELPVDLYLA